MKVLLIRNNEISIEFIEEHLARNGTEGEVLVAMPEELALEIAEGIDFDLVVCGVEGYLKKVIEDFLFKVKQISKGSYSIAVLRRETLKEMGPVFFNNIDDFITSPVDSDEFALRLMKAISNAKNHHPADTPVFGIGRLHDVSSPSSKLFDDDLQDVSIREVVNEEGVSATEVEDTSRQEEIDYPTSEQDTGHMTFDELSYDELLRRRELMLEREAESRALEEELMTTAGSPEAEAEEAVTIEPEPLNDELSYDENPGQGELMLERESEVRFEDVESIGYSMQDPDFISAGEVDMKQADQVSEADASIAEQPRDSKPEVRSVKEEKLQEEIDLLKHLRKDYGAKTSKVERFGLKKEKKRKKAEAEKEKSASKSGRGIFTIIARVMALMLVLIAGATVYFYAASNIGDGVPAIAGYKLTAMRTATMEPTLRLGDLVISVDVSVDDIKEKDIITFKVGNSQGMVECHRVVRIETSPEGKTLLITQGDGMTSEDEFPVEHDMIVGKVTRYIPFAGFIVNVDTLRFALASVK